MTLSAREKARGNNNGLSQIPPKRRKKKKKKKKKEEEEEEIKQEPLAVARFLLPISNLLPSTVYTITPLDTQYNDSALSHPHEKE